MSPAYGKVEKEQPMAGFIDSANFPQHSADPGATYTALLPLSDVARHSTGWSKCDNYF